MNKPSSFSPTPAAPDPICLKRLSASQKPPALLQMLHERARWFHQYPPQSPLLLSLEQHLPKSE